MIKIEMVKCDHCNNEKDYIIDPTVTTVKRRDGGSSYIRIKCDNCNHYINHTLSWKESIPLVPAESFSVQ